MERHVWINPSRLRRGKKTTKVDGVELFVELSPFDTPKAIVGTYVPQQRCFTIGFQYIDQEPPKHPPSVHEGITIYEGKFSGKLLSISIAIDEPPLDRVGIISLRTKFLNALKTRRESRNPPNQLNQEVAEDIIKEKEFEELAEELVGAE